MPCVQPGIIRSFFRFLLRYSLIVINCFFVYWRIDKINSIINKNENDGRIYNETVNLIVMIVDLVLNVIFILASDIKNMKLLKISLFGNITLLIVFTVYSFCMFGYYSCSLYLQYQISVKWIYLKPLFGNLGVVTSGASIEILIAYAMLLLCNEIKELKTNNYLFRFINTAAEGKCMMEREKQNEIANEKEGEEDTLEIGEVKEGTQATSKEEACDSLNNVIETKCTIECKGRNIDEDNERLGNLEMKTYLTNERKVKE